MAHFRCDYCGHQQAAPIEFLHQLAHCPACRRLSAIQDDFRSAKRIPFGVETFLGSWPRIALCGIGGLLTIIGTWSYLGAHRLDDHSGIAPRTNSANSDAKLLVPATHSASKTGTAVPHPQIPTPGSPVNRTTSGSRPDPQVPTSKGDAKTPPPSENKGAPTHRKPRMKQMNPALIAANDR